MKTKDLIALLKEEDPSGELECCIGNCDIYYVGSEPAYYDGCLQVLERDPNNKYYNIIGGRYVSTGTKIVLTPLSIREAIFNDEDLPVTYEGEYTERNYKERVDSFRKEAKEIKEGVARDIFVEYMLKRIDVYCDDFDEEEVKQAAETFFNENMSDKDPYPEDIAKQIYISPSERRNLQWNRELAVEMVDNKLHIKKV